LPGPTSVPELATWSAGVHSETVGAGTAASAGCTSARARATGSPITHRKPAATLRTRIQLLLSTSVFMATASVAVCPVAADGFLRLQPRCRAQAAGTRRVSTGCRGLGLYRPPWVLRTRQHGHRDWHRRC